MTVDSVIERLEALLSDLRASRGDAPPTVGKPFEAPEPTRLLKPHPEDPYLVSVNGGPYRAVKTVGIANLAAALGDGTPLPVDELCKRLSVDVLGLGAMLGELSRFLLDTGEFDVSLRTFDDGQRRQTVQVVTLPQGDDR